MTKPRIIRHDGMYIAIAMSVPDTMAKDRFSFEEWISCYGEKTAAVKILSEASGRDAHIVDISINWIISEFYFKMIFKSESSVAEFMRAIDEFIEKI